MHLLQQPAKNLHIIELQCCPGQQGKLSNVNVNPFWIKMAAVPSRTLRCVKSSIQLLPSAYQHLVRAHTPFLPPNQQCQMRAKAQLWYSTYDRKNTLVPFSEHDIYTHHIHYCAQRCCSCPYRYSQVRPGAVTAAAHRAALARHTSASHIQARSHHVWLPVRSSSTVSDRLLSTGLRRGQSTSSGRTTSPSQHVRPPGFCCRWPDGLELFPR